MDGTDNQTAELLKNRTAEKFLLNRENVCLRPILKGGSDRVFYHVEKNDQRFCILMHYGEEKRENFYYVNIANFLRELGVPAPNILAHDEKYRIIWMQDLGEKDIYSLRDKDWDLRKDYYQSALKSVRIVHDNGIEKWEQKPFALMDGFGAELYQWEQEYFWKQFVEDTCRLELPLSEKEKIHSELLTLTERLCALPQRLIHRDFQSQNLMIYDEKVFFIDFQGMRTGSLFYDLGSLLYDPYVDLTSVQKIELLRYYYELREHVMDWHSFERAFYEASTQRLLQALGAYGCLGLKKGKPHFLKYIPTALQHLKSSMEHLDNFDSMRNLLKALEEEGQKCASYFSCAENAETL